MMAPGAPAAPPPLRRPRGRFRVRRVGVASVPVTPMPEPGDPCPGAFQSSTVSHRRSGVEDCAEMPNPSRGGWHRLGALRGVESRKRGPTRDRVGGHQPRDECVVQADAAPMVYSMQLQADNICVTSVRCKGIVPIHSGWIYSDGGRIVRIVVEGRIRLTGGHLSSLLLATTVVFVTPMPLPCEIRAPASSPRLAGAGRTCTAPSSRRPTASRRPDGPADGGRRGEIDGSRCGPVLTTSRG